jgi:hypothetical protein
MTTMARERNRCFPRPPREEKGRPNICWYKAALNRLGYYTPDPEKGITDDENDPNFRDALYAFQRQGAVYFGDTEIGSGTTTERVLKRYKDVSNKELKKAIKSYDKQINRHHEKIKNPEKEIPNFKSLEQKTSKKFIKEKMAFGNKNVGRRKRNYEENIR